MKYSFQRNTKNVHEIYKEYSGGLLYVDNSYQRRKVWNEEDKIRLIETMLLDLVLPEVYFWTAERDPETGVSTTHIVDGQQRISTIVDFIDGKTDRKPFILKEKSLISPEIKLKCKNKSFKELPSDYKKKIWEYPISVVEIDSDCTIDLIKTMFFRLNLTNYSLLPQERRHSIASSFGDKATSLSTIDFWNKVKVFSPDDVRRMRDVEYCCSIYILANEGVVGETTDKKINQYYDDYKEEAGNIFDEDDALEDKITAATEIIEKLIDKQTIAFISKKAQLYTLFSVVFSMMDNSISYSEDIFIKFKAFTNAYSMFKNDLDITYEDTQKAEILATIKQYKLATSEGINKIKNRMIRYQIINELFTELPIEIIDTLNEMANDFESKIDTSKRDITDIYDSNDN